MTAGDYNGDGKDEMLTFRRAGNWRYVNRGNPISGGIGQTIYSTNAREVLAMVSGDFVAAFQNSFGSEVHPGDGTTSLYNYGTFHKWEWP